MSALFAGLLTKVGIYALLRVLVMLLPAERAVLSGLIGWIAVATMILGASARWRRPISAGCSASW